MSAKSVKYYAHFLIQEKPPGSIQEYRGVVEVSRVCENSGAPRVLAKTFACNVKAIKLLVWSRMH